jgi:hypothetical protein
MIPDAGVLRGSKYDVDAAGAGARQSIDKIAVLFGFVGFQAIEELLLRLGELQRFGDGRAAKLAVFSAAIVEGAGAGWAFEAHGHLYEKYCRKDAKERKEQIRRA